MELVRFVFDGGVSLRFEGRWVDRMVLGFSFDIGRGHTLHPDYLEFGCIEK